MPGDGLARACFWASLAVLLALQFLFFRLLVFIAVGKSLLLLLYWKLYLVRSYMDANIRQDLRCRGQERSAEDTATARTNRLTRH